MVNDSCFQFIVCKGLSDRSACTLAAAASVASGEQKLHHGGANLTKTGFPGFGEWGYEGKEKGILC
jgi:hypothetical protein